MKVLFVIKDTYMIERIGIMTLSAILKRAGHDTEVMKTEVGDVERKMQEYEPDVLCYTLMTGEHNYFLDLNRSLKKKFKFFSIFGGIHSTFVPQTIEEEGVDCICIGEGDDAILELVNALQEGKPYDHIQNLWIKKPDGTIAKNKLRDLITDLESLPRIGICLQKTIPF